MATRRSLSFFGVLLLAVVLAGCTSSSTGPTPFSYSGTWTGTINDSVGGPGSITTTMSQSGSELAGTWQATFTGGGNNGGTLAGVINDQEVLIELYPSDPSSCPFAVVAQRSGSTLAGTYAAFDCTVAVTGTLTVTKQ